MRWNCSTIEVLIASRRVVDTLLTSMIWDSQALEALLCLERAEVVVVQGGIEMAQDVQTLPSLDLI